MGSRSSWRRVRVERGIYLLPNGKYAVVCRRAGRQRYRTVGSDLALARSEREALIAAAEAGVAPASPRVRFGTVAGWWLERFEAKVAAARAASPHARVPPVPPRASLAPGPRGQANVRAVGR